MLRRGEIYWLEPPPADPRRFRAFVVVSRPAFLSVPYSTVICAPIYSRFSGVASEIAVGVESGLKWPSYVRCDELMSLPRARLTRYLGALSPDSVDALDRALAIALGLL